MNFLHDWSTHVVVFLLIIGSAVLAKGLFEVFVLKKKSPPVQGATPKNLFPDLTPLSLEQLPTPFQSFATFYTFYQFNRPTPNAPLLLQVEGHHAVNLWEKLAKQCHSQVYWPVIIGQADQPTLDWLQNQLALPPSTLSSAQDLATWCQEQQQLRLLPSAPSAPQKIPPSPNNQYTVQLNMDTHRPHGKVFIALFPTAQWWTLPTKLNYGNQHHCPAPSIHTQLLQQWVEHYGIELVGLTPNVLECRVNRPPSQLQDTETLAQTMFYYCPDIVQEGLGSIEALQHILVNATVWTFWWNTNPAQ